MPARDLVASGSIPQPTLPRRTIRACRAGRRAPAASSRVSDVTPVDLAVRDAHLHSPNTSGEEQQDGFLHHGISRPDAVIEPYRCTEIPHRWSRCSGRTRGVDDSQLHP